MSQGQRRLAAVMFSDMVGYTTLGQENESLSLALVEEQRNLIRPILVRHNGREVKTIGDGFLVEFPNALDAVRCAYDIQRASRELSFSLPEEQRIRLRVGIHLGDVVEHEGDIAGDAVNIASRIEPLAKVGGVCISREVFSQVRNKFPVPLSSLGPRALKNLTSPVEVYEMQMPWKDGVSLPEQLDKRRIAVLPFANVSPDPSDEYFADGLTEELIDRLSQIKELEVIARTSAMVFKKRDKKAAEIAKELNVGSLVEGSVRKSGARIRVTAQLIDGNTEGHLWSSRYDKGLDDIFAVQSDIAEQVTEALRVHVLENEKAAMGRHSSESAEAYTLYLKGRHYWNERTKEALDKAILYFKTALEKDKRLAVAYAGIADSYTIMLDRGYESSKEVIRLALANAEKALEIDESLADARAALGEVYQHTYQWSSAERELKRAIELNPSLSRAHHWLGVNYELQNKWSQAVEEYMIALQLDPLSKHLMGTAAYSMVVDGRIEEGLKLAQEAVSRFPDGYWGHISLSLGSYRTSRPDAAVEEAKRAFETGEGHPWPAAFYIYILREVGRVEEAKDIAKKYLTTDGTKPWNPSQLAMVFLGTKEDGKAFELLAKAYETSDPGLIYLGFPPIFDSVRSDPRFLDLMRKVKPDVMP